MSWLGRLQLDYARDGARTIAHDRHEGPLRVLQRLYPEGDAVCHHVLVHPPGGLVGGDRLEVHAHLDPGTHALVTTPAATRYYRSSGAPALQSVHAELADGARLEWLPLETIAYRGCLGENRLQFDLAPGAQMLGWDVLALGLPAADEAFDRGSFQQHLELPGVWLERGRINADDRALLDSPLGWAGERVLATLWFASGRAIDAALRDALLASAREIAGASPLARRCGTSAPQTELIVLRALAPRVEPAMRLLQQVWSNWRQLAWQLDPCAPRVWAT